MHARLAPKKNRFSYKTFNIAINLSQLDTLPIPHNRFGLLSFYDRDHGSGGEISLTDWAYDMLNAHGLGHIKGDILLITMPRVLGYVFNPVSFWLCHDASGTCRAVLCEVNNTFGERHVYLCAHADGSAITRLKKLEAEKHFHVSPMLQREGHYQFLFDLSSDRFGVWIDHYDENNHKLLSTWLIGEYRPMTSKTVRQVFFRYPLVTLKVTLLIHWQALKLLCKGIRYIAKPVQKAIRVSRTTNVTKM